MWSDRDELFINIKKFSPSEIMTALQMIVNGKYMPLEQGYQLKEFCEKIAPIMKAAQKSFEKNEGRKFPILVDYNTGDFIREATMEEAQVYASLPLRKDGNKIFIPEDVPNFRLCAVNYI